MSRSRMGPRPPGGSQVKVAEAPLPDLFHMLVDGVTDYAIVLLDSEGRVLTWNVGAERMTGYRAEEAIGRPISHFYPREEVASAMWSASWPAPPARVAPKTRAGARARTGRASGPTPCSPPSVN